MSALSPIPSPSVSALSVASSGKASSVSATPSTAQTYENLAICSQVQGDIFAAIEYLNKALNFEPTRQNSLYLLAELYASQNEHDKALITIKSYERVVGPNPDSMYLSFDVGLSQGDEEKARGWLNVLKSRYPSHPNTLQAQTKLDEYILQVKKQTQAIFVRQQIRRQTRPQRQCLTQ